LVKEILNTIQLSHDPKNNYPMNASTHKTHHKIPITYTVGKISTGYNYLASSFILFSALPALNHVICSSLNEWFSLISSVSPF